VSSYVIVGAGGIGVTLAAQLRMSGVQRGPLFGAPPSGRTFTGQSISWISCPDGQIIRYNVLPDRLGILRQLTGP
jgi:predicted ester cyclase